MESRYIYYDSPSQTVKIIEDCQTLINLVGIIKEKKDNSFDFAHHLVPMALVKAAQDAGVKRFIQMSALGVDSDIDTEYFETKRLGENLVKASGLNWTIFRPSLVFGPGDHLTGLLAKAVKYAPFFPVIGDGKYEFMPVHVENVADGFVQSIDKPETFGKIYDVIGPDALTFDQLIDAIGAAIGKKRVLKLHQPLPLIMLMARLGGPLLPGPLSADSIKMLVAGSKSDNNDFFQTFDTRPVGFAEGIREYLRK